MATWRSEAETSCSFFGLLGFNVNLCHSRISDSGFRESLIFPRKSVINVNLWEGRFKQTAIRARSSSSQRELVCKASVYFCNFFPDNTFRKPEIVAASGTVIKRKHNFQPRLAQKSIESWIILLNVSISPCLVFLFGLPLLVYCSLPRIALVMKRLKKKRERH